MDVRVGLWRRLSAEELMLLNCGVGEDSWESLGLQGGPTSPFWKRSTLGFPWKDDAKAEAPVLWPSHAKSWLIGKDPDAGRDWGQEEKGMTEDEMAGWYHRLDGPSLSELREMVMDREAWRPAFHGVAKCWTRLSEWTEMNLKIFKNNLISLGSKYNYLLVWTFFSTALHGNCDEDWLFQSCGHCCVFQISWHI